MEMHVIEESVDVAMALTEMAVDAFVAIIALVDIVLVVVANVEVEVVIKVRDREG